MKKILVTGADGFIGSHLAEMCVQKGHKVKALVQYNSFNSWGWLEKSPYKNDMEIISGDIRDPYFCQELATNVEVIFHLAALIAIPYSYVAPNSYLETNVGGTINICQAALKNKVEHVIHTSTSEVYGTALYVPIDEKHPLQPQSPYSASKIAADAFAQSFYNSFKLPLTIARPFNTFGPRQSARAVIPTIISQLNAGMKEIKLGDVRPTRDFNYVLDTCNGFLDIMIHAKQEQYGTVLNIGSNFEISVRDTFELIKNLMNNSALLVEDKLRMRPENSEVHRLWCNNEKIQKLTGFKPKFTLEQGLKETIKWFSMKENLDHYKADIYNV